MSAAAPDGEDDLALLHRWRCGDDAAEEELVQRRCPSVRRVVGNEVSEGIEAQARQQDEST